MLVKRELNAKSNDGGDVSESESDPGDLISAIMKYT